MKAQKPTYIYIKYLYVRVPGKFVVIAGPISSDGIPGKLSRETSIIVVFLMTKETPERLAGSAGGPCNS